MAFKRRIQRKESSQKKTTGRIVSILKVLFQPKNIAVFRSSKNIYIVGTCEKCLSKMLLLTIKKGQENLHLKMSSVYVVCCILCHLFMSSAANFSNIFFAYRQTVWTKIRLLLEELSDLSTLFATMTYKVFGRRQSRRQLLCLVS